MNSKEKKSTASKSYEKKPPRIMPLMTPRTLVPSTPIRFNSTESSISITSHNDRIIKGVQKSGKNKTNIPLAPGYVDRSAQRRSGTEVELLSFECESLQEESTDLDQNQKQNILKTKHEFLEEFEFKFPNCSKESTESIMKLILEPNSNSKTRNVIGKNNFLPNQAFLRFKSIEESKTQPFDPFSRPKKVFRASLKNNSNSQEDDDDEEEEVLNRVKEAMKRLKSYTERNQKYLQVLHKESRKFEIFSENNVVSDSNKCVDHLVDDIFPDAGRFDERSELEKKIKSEQQIKPIIETKIKAKERLFGSIKSQKSTIEKEIEKQEEIDIFELIAQKSLDDVDDKKQKKMTEIDESGGGGLFGFSSVLPKLSRLEVVDNSFSSSGGGGVKLTGAYASILSDEEREGEEVNEEFKRTRQEQDLDDNDDSLYPGYLENDPITHDSDDEDFGKDVGISVKNKKRKLAVREDKEAAKIEKLVKSKFGVDLLK